MQDYNQTPVTTGRFRAVNQIRAVRLQEARLRGTHTPEQWRAIVERAGGYCERCGSLCVRLTKDHITPINEGGSDAVENLRALCRSCNSGRSPRHAGTLAEEIKRVRDMLAESTEAFALRFFCSPRTIEDWEQGRRHPDAIAVRELSRVRLYANRRASKRRLKAARARRKK